MGRSSWLEHALNVAVTLAVVAVAAAVIRRELFPPQSPRLPAPAQPMLAEVGDWEEIVSAGVVPPRSLGPVQIAVFEDIECPYCKRFHETVLMPLLERYGDSVTPIFVHLPLAIHRFAEQAAQALECAHAAGRAADFIRLAFASQDSLGLIGWGTLGGRAGISDTADFGACAVSRELHPRIQRGLNLAAKLDVDATPTVVVNGLRFSIPPSLERLEAVVDSLLRARRS